MTLTVRITLTYCTKDNAHNFGAAVLDVAPVGVSLGCGGGEGEKRSAGHDGGCGVSSGGLDSESAQAMVNELRSAPRVRELAQRIRASQAGPAAHVATHPPPAPASYQFSWTAPSTASPPGSAGLVVVIVNPNWADQSIALQPTYRSFSAGFASSLGADFDKILLGKGIGATGPYGTYDDITYGDKKAANLALTPRVFLTATFDAGDPTPVGSDGFTDYFERKFSMTAQGFVEFVLVEALSREKLWVKKLDLDPVTVTGADDYAAKSVDLAQPDCAGKRKPAPDDNTTVENGVTCALTRREMGDLVYDGKEKALADAMKGWYPVIAQKAWTYLDPQEMATLKPQVAEIRARSTSIVH